MGQGGGNAPFLAPHPAKTPCIRAGQLGMGWEFAGMRGSVGIEVTA